MGSETKVGLLVGMCFIVCFAIILAHRGAPDPQLVRPAFEITTADMPPATAQPSTASPRATPAPQREATRSPERRNATNSELPTRRSTPPSEPPQHLAQRTETPGPSNTPDPDRFTRRTTPVPAPVTIDQLDNLLNQTEAIAHADVAADADGSETGETIVGPSAADRRVAVGPTEPQSSIARIGTDALASAGYQLASRVREEQARRQAGTAGPREIPQELTGDEPAAPEPEAPVVADAPLRIRESYTVLPGDTLSGIARKKYGSNKPSVLAAIVAANKAQLKSPDRLVVGKALRLPELPELAATPVNPIADQATVVAAAPEQPKDAAEHLRDELTRMTAAPQPLVAPTGVATAAQDTHVVQPGETLSRIVRSHYGTADPALIRAVYEANRKQMKSPNTLAAGMKLILPERARPAGDVSADNSLVAQTGPADTVTAPITAVASTPPAERWYVVQPGDLLSTVAQKELGTSRRWREIADLNKKAFPDPGHIRSGARIRLPLDGMQTADASTVGATR